MIVLHALQVMIMIVAEYIIEISHGRDQYKFHANTPPY